MEKRDLLLVRFTSDMSRHPNHNRISVGYVPTRHLLNIATVPIQARRFTILLCGYRQHEVTSPLGRFIVHTPPNGGCSAPDLRAATMRRMPLSPTVRRVTACFR